MHEHNNRNITKWVIPNSVKYYKTEIVVHQNFFFIA